MARSRWLTAAVAALVLAGCTKKQPPDETFFDRTIEPILRTSCVSANTGASCHVADAKGNALGNLALDSYEGLAKRPDLLVSYGPYGVPAFLLKNVPPYQLATTAWDGTTQMVHVDVRHTGGAPLSPTSAAYATIARWIASGAMANGGPPPSSDSPRDPCVESIPADEGFDATHDPTTPDFARFRDEVQPIVGGTCAAGNCHGALGNSLRFVCATSAAGDAKTAELVRWNYRAASGYLAAVPEESELLRRVLAPSAGGSFHEGGVIYESTDEPEYQAMLGWAAEHGPPTDVPTTAGFEFFAHRVQPILAKKGCMMLGCHAPPVFNSYRLRGAGEGRFNLSATLENYRLTLDEVALESPDPNASRLVAKNLPRPEAMAGGRGIAHRGGPLLADLAQGLPTKGACDLDAAEHGDLDAQPAYCVIARWLDIERSERTLTPLSGIVYVRRPTPSGPDAPQDFATYTPGGDLCFAPVTVDADGRVTGAGACTSLLAGCAGLDPATADVRRPSVSFAGDLVAFAARSSASERLAIWTVHPDGSACAKEPSIAAAPVDDQGTPLPDNGALVHDFDPTFTPDGRIVFVSTRGNVTNASAFDYRGPQRTPADPSRWNANVYVLDAPGKLRQLTFLLDQELSPSVLANGQVILTAEKREPGFYQLAGRRIELAGGDYHPLYAQRRSIGYAQMTEIVELANKNLVGVFSDLGAAHGAGTLGIVNRSIGPDQHSADPADYALDPDAIAWPDPRFYLHSLTFPDPSATGHLGGANQGAYRSPARLPNGDLVVAYAPAAGDLASFAGGFDLWVVDPITGQRLVALTSDSSTDELWPAAVLERPNLGIHDQPLARVYAPGEDAEHPTDRSDVTVFDMPMFASLTFQNTRTRRVLADVRSLDLYECLPPPLGVTSFAEGGAFVASDAFGQVYARRRRLGAVAVQADGTSRFVIPGGMPFLLAGELPLAGDEGNAVHAQREQLQFYPGEYAHILLPRDRFDGFCAGCHGTISGREDDFAVRADVLTGASRAEAERHPDVMLAAPGERGADVGPPF